MKSLNFLKIGFIVMLVLLSCVFINSCVENNKLVLNNDKITLTVGNTTTITPNTRYKDIVWSSSNESVAKVNESSGKVDALSKGNATITAMLPGGEKATCEIEVEEIAITSVQLNHTNIEIKKNNSSVLTAKVYPEKASADSLEWSSGDDSIASVDNNGIVTGKKKGSTVIRCTAPSGKSANCTVKVKGEKKKAKKNTTTINNYYNSYGSSSTVTTTNNEKIYYCTLCNDYVTLRTSAFKGSSEITKVLKGEQVTLISKIDDSEFMKVSYNGYEGYVMSVYFTPYSDSRGRAVLYCRAREYANLRSCAGSDNTYNIKKIPTKAAVQFMGSTSLVKNQEYYEVTYKNMTGYVLADTFSVNPNAPLYTGN